MQLRIAFLGFGNVNRALAELLLIKQETLKDRYHIHFDVTGIATGRHGHAINPDGMDLRAVLETVRKGGSLTAFSTVPGLSDTLALVQQVPADLIFEASPTNPQDGEPALIYVRTALERGMHVVTANKGPVAFACHALEELAAQQGVGFLYEATVQGGSPVICLAREGLAGAEIRRVEGIFNNTTNFILDKMERDSASFEEALREAQAIGVAETDPSLDVDGWDAAIKTAILANVLMGANLRPADVEREGIRGVTAADIQAAAAAGERIKLLCEAERLPDGRVLARVGPRRVPADSQIGGIRGTGGVVAYEVDTMGRQTLFDAGQGPEGTAYGMLVDMINILRGRARQRAD